MTERRIEIKVPMLTRVEGEGALDVSIGPTGIDELRLRIFEPPRFFEKFLEGRQVREITDIVTRICGICPVAYQMSAVQALESLFAVDPGPWVRDMRRVYYCGEWLESHSLHMHLLALPDFLGFGSVADMAAKYPAQVQRGLMLQELGNDLIRLLGARSVNPLGARPGGFYHAPEPEQVAALLPRLEAAEVLAEELLQWVMSLPVPDMEQEFTSVALTGSDLYPIMEGDIGSDDGLSCTAAQFEDHFQEQQVPHSTALHCLLHGKPYLTGPLARLNLNHLQLDQSVRDALAAGGIALPSRNIFHSIVARAAEIWQAIKDSRRILENYSVPAQAAVDYQIRSGTGYGVSEAPRGILWHRYDIDEQGLVGACRIVPPTSQNQAQIEQDLRFSLEQSGLDRPEAELRNLAEQVIRNYDPCISCATHFLRLRVQRR